MHYSGIPRYTQLVLVYGIVNRNICSKLSRKVGVTMPCFKNPQFGCYFFRYYAYTSYSYAWAYITTHNWRLVTNCPLKQADTPNNKKNQNLQIRLNKESIYMQELFQGCFTKKNQRRYFRFPPQATDLNNAIHISGHRLQFMWKFLFV